MPRADVGTEQTSTTGGKKGEFLVKYASIAPETMKPKSPDSPFRESLRVVFDVVGKQDDTVSLGIAIEDPTNDLWGFVGNPTAAPTEEAALRQFVEANVVREPVEVYVREFIRSRLATEGEQTFERIIGIWKYNNAEGAPRIGMTAVTKDGLTTTWNCKEPQLKKERGRTGPEGDYIGTDAELNPNQYVFQYLQAFGLDWEKMKAEDLADAKAYWPGHADSDDVEIKPLFPDIENPWPGFLAMVGRHGGNPVKMEITRHETYGLGPKRVGQFPIVKMTPIERDSSASAEFEQEKAVFLEMWDNLTKVLLSEDAARFLAGTALTDDGRAVAVSVLVPLVRAYPDAVRGPAKPDGSPAVHLPPTPETWNLNGLVAANYTAERLMKLDQGDLFHIVHLSDPEGGNLLEWAAETVPEWQGVGFTEEGGETL